MQANMENEMYASVQLAQRELDTARYVAQRRALREVELGAGRLPRSSGRWTWLKNIAARLHGGPALEAAER